MADQCRTSHYDTGVKHYANRFSCLPSLLPYLTPPNIPFLSLCSPSRFPPLPTTNGLQTSYGSEGALLAPTEEPRPKKPLVHFEPTILVAFEKSPDFLKVPPPPRMLFLILFD